MTHAEQSVIGSMLIDENCIEDIASKLTAEDFQNETFQKIFSAIVNRWFNHEPTDPVLIASDLNANDDIAKLLIACMDVTPTAVNAMEYADIILKESQHRKACEVAERLMDGDDAALCASDLMEISERYGQKEVTSGEKWANRFTDVLKKNMADPDSAFCKTGFSELDDLLGGGMIKGGVYILGARPGMGKTTVALNIAENIAKRGQTVLFISLEMSTHQIMCKRIAISGFIFYKHILTGKLNNEEQETVFQMLDRIKDRPFITNTGFSLTVSDIGNIARKIKDCSCVIVDYFGLITSPDSGKGGSRYEIYSDISRQLKQLAGTLNLPILCLAQLNREVEKGRQNKKPQLADLRDTGSLEQDADSVIFLHRDGYYKKDEDVKDENIDIIVRKNRHGDCGEVKMYWYGQTGQICSFEKQRKEQSRAEINSLVDGLPD